jgi:hypothetical protein
MQTSAVALDPDLYYPGQTVTQGVTVFVYGAPGTRKTTFAGQWPKPVVLSVGAEGGDDALAMLHSIYGVPVPPVYRITTCKQMVEKVDYIVANYKKNDWNTIVVDSVTFYADLWITELMELRMDQPKIKAKVEKEGGEATSMAMRDWGLLAMHLKMLATKLHNTPLNVIWTALEKENREQNEAQGISAITSIDPAIKGEMAMKLPAMCKMIIYAQKDIKADMANPGMMVSNPVFRTAPTYLAKLPRHKYGNAFPEGRLVDPQYGDIATFGAVASRIGNFIYHT